VLPVFQWLASAGNVAQDEMLRTFNCGIGMIAVVSAADSSKAIAAFTQAGEKPVVIGEIMLAAGAERVRYDGRLTLG
jgi:phosphoribosylformylglycinamidine cyclo-ligase